MSSARVSHSCRRNSAARSEVELPAEDSAKGLVPASDGHERPAPCGKGASPPPNGLAAPKGQGSAMQIMRRYTSAGQDPFAAFNFVPRISRIVNPDGTVVFEMKDVLVPDGWSQVAVDILAQKYFRRASVPAQAER